MIHVKGARLHNLKNIELKLNHNELIVITGVSGSGKSTLAFDTLYAEGQRRYVESLSSYARQFLGRINKPEVDFIKGIPPAIAIEQKVSTRNPRSTVGTSTEIYDYMKLLFARIGDTISPISGCVVKKHDVTDVVDFMLKQPEGTMILVLMPFNCGQKYSTEDKLSLIVQQGYSRLELDGEMLRIDSAETIEKIHGNEARLNIIIDRISVNNDPDTLGRMGDSVQSAFSEGDGTCTVKIYADGKISASKIFSHRFELDGISFEEPSVDMFSFNNPLGACSVCEGYGKVVGIDEDLVIPNKNLSVYEEAVACWKGEKMSRWKDELILNSSKFDFPIHRPIIDLTEEQYKLLWTGNQYFRGINSFFKYVEENTYKIQFRVMQARYRGKTICPECKGSRLKKEAGYVKVGGKSMQELVLMPISELQTFFAELKLTKHQESIAKRLMKEINNRLGYLCDVGLSYLTLNRLSNTLSGGESQRINLVTSLGSGLVGSLYILDEPSIGLHPRDTQRLISVLLKLKELGNTVIVVEHDEEIMRAADTIVDIGPLAGVHGGEVVFSGNFNQLEGSDSLTAKYLTGVEKIEVPTVRRKWNNYLKITGARENNLKNIDVKIPLNVFTVVTGVSGSGKSTLIKQILYPILAKQFDTYVEKTGKYGKFEGDIHLLKAVEFVDQNPIGKSTRSNPVTYMKAYDDIRKLMSEQPSAARLGLKPAHFSFNVEGGRCEECQGEGVIKVEMQFMADVTLVCDSCHGRRFKDDVLEVTYNGKNVYDILQMTINQAVDFFGASTGATEQKIVQKIKPLQDVGLGYVQLGQSSSTLSGGESQRVKLASFLGKEKDEPTMFIFDEPTTGLHFHDIKKLLNSFEALISHGHSVVVIEHNVDVIKTADHIIDLGPEGGSNGGYLLFEGTPEKLIKCKESYTAKYLKDKLK